ncbi:ATP-binding protein [Halomonas piscis]|uniref:histidine kinase n=1 Tax=Halomonas piscis TaxID=3031727 RepID=A0ABY9Z4G9_9GAMM|nr:ATP-binding protein [Halomonas piscis]WNK21238.1 ATP-binding protein [Halomonas piscis]
MSLRARLLLTLGLALALFWASAAAWLAKDLEDKLVETLDQRLAQSARMVAGLMLQLPPEAWQQADRRSLSIPPIEGLACQVHSPRGEIMARTHSDLEGVLDPREPGHAYRREDGVTWRVFTYRRGGLTITTADRMDERDTVMSGVLWVAVVPFIVALVGSLVALWVAVWRGLAPLSRLRESLARRDPDTLAPVALKGLPAELRPLVATLNSLLVRVDEAFAREQRFTNDAAHELRTPLTAIKTHVQVAKRVKGQAAIDALDYAEQGIVRLNRTLDQLLLLARVEGRKPWQEPSCDAASVAQCAVEDTGHPERVRLPAEWPGAKLLMPHELAVTALRNVLDNALRHGPPETPVRLEARWIDNNAPEGGAASGHTAELAFCVRDEGAGLSPQGLSQLTRRFWRDSRAGGSGLGLAIVAAIVERFGGRLAFHSPPGEGLSVELFVPAVAPDHGDRAP